MPYVEKDANGAVIGAYTAAQYVGQVYLDPDDPKCASFLLETVKPIWVTPLQARRALIAAGLLATVTAAVNAGTIDTQQAWEYASVFNRFDPLLLKIASTLGWSSDQLDQLFLLASSFT